MFQEPNHPDRVKYETSGIQRNKRRYTHLGIKEADGFDDAVGG